MYEHDCYCITFECEGVSITIPSSDWQERKLFEAAKAGRVEEVAALLNQGVNIQCKDKVILRLVGSSLFRDTGSILTM